MNFTVDRTVALWSKSAKISPLIYQIYQSDLTDSLDLTRSPPVKPAVAALLELCRGYPPFAGDSGRSASGGR